MECTKKPRILLINPPQTVYPASIGLFVGLPLGLMYIAAVLDKAGFETEILDTLVRKCERIKTGGAEHYGMSFENIGKEIAGRKPDIVGINGATMPHIENAIRTAELVKKINPKILTIIGGNDATVRAEALLRENPAIDVVIRGEGEYTLLEIAEKWKGMPSSIKGIKGTAYMENKKVKINEPRPFIQNLDELPFPAYHLVNMEDYFDPEKKVELWGGGAHLRDIPFITSRGCPMRCCFCSIHLHMGRQWRAHSAEYVIRHLKHVIENYRVEHIHFDDDNIAIDKQRLHKILDGIAAEKLKFTWDTPNGIRADRLDMDLLVKMKKTGCELLIISPESGDQWVLDNIVHKALKLTDVENVAAMCQKLKIPLGALFIIGFPDETKEQIQHTIDFSLMLTRKYDVQWRGIIIAVPMFGTEMHEICRERNYIASKLTPQSLSEAMYAGGRPLITTPEFTPEEITSIALAANKAGNMLHLRKYIRHPAQALVLIAKQPKRPVWFIRKLLRGRK